MRRTLPWLPIVLLALVASVHAVLVSRYDLSRWLGGGFGMFSTTDSASSRHVHLYVRGNEGRTALSISDDLDEAMRHARVFPTTRATRRFAAIVAAHPSAKGAAIDVEVWQTSYDAVTMAPTSRLLRAESVEAARGHR